MISLTLSGSAKSGIRADWRVQQATACVEALVWRSACDLTTLIEVEKWQE